MGLRENLRRIREERSLSQRELAKRSKVSQQLISQIENGKNTTTKPVYLQKLSAALSVSIADLAPDYMSHADDWRSLILSALSKAANDHADPVDVYDIIEQHFPNPVRAALRTLLETSPDQLQEAVRVAERLNARRRNEHASDN
jgi:transcriptional regulator with XRE-family HTH domain